MKKLVIVTMVFILGLISYGSPEEDQEAFVKIAEKVMPAVVNINTEKTIKQSFNYEDPFENLFNDPAFRRFFGNPPQRGPRQTQRKAKSLGSGFVISEEGYVVTNNHVIDGADKIEVTFENKDTYEAEIVGTDPDSDLAVLKIKATKKFPFIEMGDSEKIKIGQWAIAIGNPFGLNNTMTVGIVSAKGRSGIGIENYEDFIQTDASINPGNSGGPLVDIRGKVIGVNTAIISKSGGNMGIGFAIPVNMAKRITDSLISTGKVERGWLGVSIQPLTAEMAKQFGLENAEGALIGEVMKDSPAEKAGIKRGDIVLQINENNVKDFNDLRNKIAAIEPNQKAKLTVMRNKKKLEIDVVLGKRTESGIYSGDEAKIFGMKLKELDGDLREKFSYNKDTKGIIVLEVEYDSLAQESGINPGDVILEINNKEIENLKSFMKEYDSVKKGENILLYVIGKNVSRYVIIRKE